MTTIPCEYDNSFDYSLSCKCHTSNECPITEQIEEYLFANDKLLYNHNYNYNKSYINWNLASRYCDISDYVLDNRVVWNEVNKNTYNKYYIYRRALCSIELYDKLDWKYILDNFGSNGFRHKESRKYFNKLQEEYESSQIQMSRDKYKYKRILCDIISIKSPNLSCSIVADVVPLAKLSAYCLYDPTKVYRDSDLRIIGKYVGLSLREYQRLNILPIYSECIHADLGRMNVEFLKSENIIWNSVCKCRHGGDCYMTPRLERFSYANGEKIEGHRYRSSPIIAQLN